MARDEKGRFLKGNTEGQGRKKLPDDVRESRNMAYEDLLKAIIEVRNLSIEEIKDLDLDKEPLGKRAILKAYVDNNFNLIKCYEDRLFGKAKEYLEAEVGGLNGESIRHIFEIRKIDD